MAIDADDVVGLVADELLPKWQTERTKLDRIDRWARWDHDNPHKPDHATAEYRELAARAEAPWGDLIVGSIAQTLYVEGYRRPDAPEDTSGWRYWQANGMDARQVALHRAVLSYGLAYGTVMPGRDPMTGESLPVMRCESPREMIAVYDDPANDDWPEYALRVVKLKGRVRFELYDDERRWTLEAPDLSSKPKVVKDEIHGVAVPPVVRYKNRFDLEGRSAGEIEPFIPLLGRIDQTVFDRLVVQRFGAWIVRTIAGMAVTKSAEALNVSADEVKHRLLINDILTAEDPDTKFGSLPATPMDGFIKAREADLADLAAVSQTPAFELLGQMANLSAEALAAAKASQTMKSGERQHTVGEDHEQFIRLSCHVAGDAEGAADFEAQVRWADTSIRSLAQAVDAYGKLAKLLGFPPQLLWSKVPGMTQQDVDEARQLADQAISDDAIDGLLAELERTPPGEA